MNKVAVFCLVLAVCVLMGAIIAYKLAGTSPSLALPEGSRRNPSGDPVQSASRQDAAISKSQWSHEEDVALLVRQARVEIGTKHPDLLSTLDSVLDSETDVRAEAIRALGFAEVPELLGLIISVLASDPEPEVRAAAAASLDIYDASPQASFALIHALDDANATVREDALLSLKAHRNDVVKNELRRKLQGGNMAPETAEDVKLVLDRYYVRKDPFQNPLGK